MLRRLPIDSAQPGLVFAAARLLLAVLALIAIVALGLPYGGRGVALIGGLLVPWSILVLVLAQRAPHAAMSPLIAVGDFAILVTIQVVIPESIGAVRYSALFLIAAHAHFQGERRGVAIAAAGAGALVLASALRGETNIHGGLRAFYEAVFVVAAVATGAVVGRLRTAESASRMRAHRLSRRAIQAESEVRRRVAEAIHDGPIQELIGLDMMLATAAQAAREGEDARADELIGEARVVASRNILALRDEIVDLGPYAFEELGFATAIEHCIAPWKRRFGFEVLATIEAIDLPPHVAGDLFRIAAEAVVNAGRHAEARNVSISLRRVGADVELRVTDDGHGFQGADPLGATQPGHLGLASMRERAELMGGTLDIETSARGTRVLALVPLAAGAM
jgi:two-component system, NarL family, sensor kinase